jgi:hypothetical protein
LTPRVGAIVAFMSRSMQSAEQIYELVGRAVQLFQPLLAIGTALDMPRQSVKLRRVP